MLGLFIVLATAAGCLYFLDPTNIANSTGLEAVGIVLLVLNIGYIVVMLILIAVTGAPKTKRFTCSAVAMVKTISSKFKRSVSGLSCTSSRSTSRQDMAEISESS